LGDFFFGSKMPLESSRRSPSAVELAPGALEGRVVGEEDAGLHAQSVERAALEHLGHRLERVGDELEPAAPR
jgi:hypothetical protein